MDVAGYVVFRVLAQHIAQADAGFDTPLPMLPAPENYGRLEADIPSLELFFAVAGIGRIGVDVIGVGNRHEGELRSQADGSHSPIGYEVIAGLAEEIGHGHPVGVSPYPSDMIDFSQLGAYSGTGHYGPLLSQPDVQSIREAKHGAREDIICPVAGFTEQTCSDHDIALKRLRDGTLLRQGLIAQKQSKCYDKYSFNCYLSRLILRPATAENIIGLLLR